MKFHLVFFQMIILKILADDKSFENIDYNDKNQESVELDVKTDNNIEETNIEYIKLDLNQDIEQNKEILENSNVDDIDNINLKELNKIIIYFNSQ